jgi:hypothetical protein
MKPIVVCHKIVVCSNDLFVLSFSYQVSPTKIPTVWFTCHCFSLLSKSLYSTGAEPTKFVHPYDFFDHIGFTNEESNGMLLYHPYPLHSFLKIAGCSNDHFVLSLSHQVSPTKLPSVWIAWLFSRYSTDAKTNSFTPMTLPLSYLVHPYDTSSII